MFEPEIFWKHIYCTEESSRDLVVIFRRPLQSFGPQGTVPPFPLVTALLPSAIFINTEKFYQCSIITNFFSGLTNVYKTIFGEVKQV